MPSHRSFNHSDHDDDEESTIDTTSKILRYRIFNSYCHINDLFPVSEVFRYPMEYMTTLVQIGYEPLPPKLGKSLFGRTQLQLPGFFTYMKYIVQTDGFFGIYRGFKFNLMFICVHQFVSINVNHYQKENYYPSLKDENAKYADTNSLAMSIVCDSTTHIAALTVAYPFHLMMVRSMAQFIGRETHYDSIFGAIADIYRNGGILGFYSGFVPYVAGECAFVFLEATLIYMLKEKFEQLGIAKSNDNSFLKMTINFFARSLVYPFKLVSTVMSCNGKNCRSLAASAYTAPEHLDWVECWQTLWERGEIKRGSSLFWRHYPLTSSLMFPMHPIVPRLKTL